MPVTLAMQAYSSQRRGFGSINAGRGGPGIVVEGIVRYFGVWPTP
jgi:hypothetical protein